MQDVTEIMRREELAQGGAVQQVALDEFRR